MSGAKREVGGERERERAKKLETTSRQSKMGAGMPPGSDLRVHCVARKARQRGECEMKMRMRVRVRVRERERVSSSLCVCVCVCGCLCSSAPKTTESEENSLATIEN